MSFVIPKQNTKIPHFIGCENVNATYCVKSLKIIWNCKCEDNMLKWNDHTKTKQNKEKTKSFFILLLKECLLWVDFAVHSKNEWKAKLKYWFFLKYKGFFCFSPDCCGEISEDEELITLFSCLCFTIALTLLSWLTFRTCSTVCWILKDSCKCQNSPKCSIFIYIHCSTKDSMSTTILLLFSQCPNKAWYS